MKFGIDFDDVLCPFVRHAVALTNEKYKTSFEETDINGWGLDGSDAIRKVSEFYSDEQTFLRQSVGPQAKFFMKELCKKGEVYIITAVPPQFMSLRAKQIKEAFPDFPERNIIMGSAKDLVKFDVTLDDAPHNILKSCADYPVLFRKPWNRELSGVLSVNNYAEFLIMIDQIKTCAIEDRKTPTEPSVIALVGPTGSNKNALADELENIFFAKRCRTLNNTSLDPDDIPVTSTEYAGNHYQVFRGQVEGILSEGQNAVLPVDMCGAMALKRLYPTTLIFCKRSRENMIEDILERNIPNHEKKIRLLSMENELKNRKLCDFTIDTENIKSAAVKVVELFGMEILTCRRGGYA